MLSNVRRVWKLGIVNSRAWSIESVALEEDLIFVEVAVLRVLICETGRVASDFVGSSAWSVLGMLERAKFRLGLVRWM